MAGGILPLSLIPHHSMSAALASHRSAARRSSADRSVCGVAAQAGCAAAASWAARATSAGVAIPVRPSSAPVAGSVTGASPPPPSTQPPEKILPRQTASSMSAIDRSLASTVRKTNDSSEGEREVPRSMMSSTEQEARLTDSREQGHDGDFVQSLERGLSVIRAFDADHAKLTLSEVATATGLSRAAARRFLRTLVQLGYMRSDGSRFALRPKILELGYAYLSSLTLPEVAMPHLEQLVEQVHESSSVSELDGDDVIYIARVPTKRIMTVTISVGTRFPAYATSMGRVLLAAQSDERLDEYLASVSLRGLTGHTITSATALRRELRKIRAQGWALVDQELEEGLRSIAAPIKDVDGQVIAAVNVSTHAGRRTLSSTVEELLQPLLATARRIELDLARSRASARVRPDA